MGLFCGWWRDCWLGTTWKGHAISIPTMQYLIEIPRNASQTVMGWHWMNATGNSGIMHYGILSKKSYFTFYLLRQTIALCIIIILVDNRKSTCWATYAAAGCEGNILPRGITRDECCNTIGAGWGSPCQSCDEYNPQCPPGYYLHMGAQCVGKS